MKKPGIPILHYCTIFSPALYLSTTSWILLVGFKMLLIEPSWFNVSIINAIYLLTSQLIYHGLSNNSGVW